MPIPKSSWAESDPGEGGGGGEADRSENGEFSVQGVKWSTMLLSV